VKKINQLILYYCTCYNCYCQYLPFEHLPYYLNSVHMRNWLEV